MLKTVEACFNNRIKIVNQSNCDFLIAQFRLFSSQFWVYVSQIWIFWKKSLNCEEKNSLSIARKIWIAIKLSELWDKKSQITFLLIFYFIVFMAEKKASIVVLLNISVETILLLYYYYLFYSIFGGDFKKKNIWNRNL